MSQKMAHATVEQLAPVVAGRSSTLTGSAVDIKDYVGDMKILQSAAQMSTSDTLDGKIQDSEDGSTGWADVSGAAFTQVDDQAAADEAIHIDTHAVKRYIRYVGTLAGTTIDANFGVSAVGVKQER